MQDEITLEEVHEWGCMMIEDHEYKMKRTQSPSKKRTYKKVIAIFKGIKKHLKPFPNENH